ncbi:MAG: PAS domain-containing protein [Planctomycetaceae bacterium]|nr:PAS domain-containing protein [Planctomycetaceae bacterium]
MTSNFGKLLDSSILEAAQDSLLESVLDCSPLIYWAIDNKGIIQISRGAGLRELNKKDGEDVGLSIFEMYADQPQVLKSVRESLEGKEFHAVIHLDDLTFESWFRPVKNDSGQVLGVIGISLVLTELKKTRIASSDQNHGFEMLKGLANTGVFTCNKQGEIQFANDYFWSCFSVIESVDSNRNNNDSRQGVLWQNLFRDEDNQSLSTAHQRLVSQGAFRRELKPVYPGGSIEWVHIQLDRIGPEEWVGTVVDITAMKQAENMFGLQRRELEKAVQARTAELVERNNQLSNEIEKRKQFAGELQVSRNHMEAIIRNAVDIILHVDRNARILFINRSASDYDTQKIIGSSLYEWIPPGNKGMIETALQKVFDNQEHVSLDIPGILRTGEQVLYSTRWGPIYHQEEVVGTTIVARDITHERQLEEEAKQRLEEISHLTRLGMLGEISATISHELKQPLLAIGNYATGCLHRISKHSIDEGQITEILQLIAELSLRARTIVQQTNEFAAKKEIMLVLVSPQELLKKSLELVQTELDRKDILLKNELDSSVPLICFDLIQGQQVIVNLLLNAIKAISNSHKQQQHIITVRSALIEDDLVQMTISDTADGIQEGDNESLFDMFHSRNKDGFGIGLSISRKIVENHGGKLRDLQTGPQGTTFEMILAVRSDCLCDDPTTSTIEPEAE